MAGLRIKAEIINLSALLKQLNAAPVEFLHAAAAEIYQEAEGIMAQAKELVPVLTGNLRDSGHVELPRVEKSSALVELGFGSSAVKYATPVHENLEAHHPRGGTAKYLELPYKAALPGMEARIAAGIRGRVK